MRADDTMHRKLISLSDLESLDGSPEDRTLELKREPIDTARMAEIIQAGANGIAPVMHIVVGSAEKDGRFDLSQSKPISYPFQIGNRGATIESFDAYKLHLADVVRSHTAGYYEGFFEVREIPLGGGSLIVVEVPQSNERPHQNTQSKKYFIKADGKVRAMDDHEIDDAITARANRRLPQKITQRSGTNGEANADKEAEQLASNPFTHEVSGLIYTSRDLMPGAQVSIIDERTGDDRDVRLGGGKASLWLRISPRTLSKHWDPTDLRDLVARNLGSLIPIYAPENRDLSYGRNNQGACVWLTNPHDRHVTYSAVQVYEEGQLWATDTLLLSTDARLGSARNLARIFGGAVETALEEALPRYVTFVNGALELPLPLEGTVGLSDIRDYRLVGHGIAESDLSGRILAPGVFDSFMIDEKSIEVVTTAPHRIFGSFYEKLWKAAGKRRR